MAIRGWRTLLKKTVYFSIIASLLSTKILAVDLGFFQLSLFRMILLFVIFCVLVEAFIKNGKIQLNINRNNRYSVRFMLVWLLYAFLSLAWAVDYNSWFRAVYFLALGLASIVICTKVFRTRFDILTGFRFMSIMVLVHNFICWYEVRTGTYLFLSADRASAYARYKLPVSVFYNTNDLATFLLISIFISYICLANSKTKPEKFAYVGLIVSSLYLLVMTGSRANIIGFIFAAAVFLWLALTTRRGRRTILLLFLCIAVFLTFNPGSAIKFISMVDQNLYLKVHGDTGSDVTRLNLAKNGFVFLSKTFGFGTGAGNIEYWMANHGKYYTGNITNIHNWWMEILAGYGVVIFCLYVIFYMTLFLSLYKKYKECNCNIDKTICLGVMAAMAGFIVGSMSSSSNIDSEWLWIFWGLLIAYQGIDYESET